MPTQTLVPVENYLYGGNDYEPDAEYVDGVIEERPMGQYDHATWQQALQLWFVQHQGQWKIRVRPEYRVCTSPTRYRVPDVVVWDRSQPIEQILTYPPIAVFEVLSPEDRLPRMMRKLADYEAMGIRNIFVIDPEDDIYSRFLDGRLLPLSAEAEPLAGWEGFIDWTSVKALQD